MYNSEKLTLQNSKKHMVRKIENNFEVKYQKVVFTCAQPGRSEALLLLEHPRKPLPFLPVQVLCFKTGQPCSLVYFSQVFLFLYQNFQGVFTSSFPSASWTPSPLLIFACCFFHCALSCSSGPSRVVGQGSG